MLTLSNYCKIHLPVPLKITSILVIPFLLYQYNYQRVKKKNLVLTTLGRARLAVNQFLVFKLAVASYLSTGMKVVPRFSSNSQQERE